METDNLFILFYNPFKYKHSDTGGTGKTSISYRHPHIHKVREPSKKGFHKENLPFLKKICLISPVIFQ